MGRPLRSLMIGDTDHYFSPYIFGVAQASARLGIWHSQISIRRDWSDLARRIGDVKPDVIWTHMLLWPPASSPPIETLLALCADARPQARVVIHDGDAKEQTRYPRDISSAVDLALLNHGYDRSAWKVDTMPWPYAAFDQDAIATASPGFICDLAFAGTVGGGIYSDRAATLQKLLRREIDFRVFSGGNTMLQTPQLAASARSVLGFGRPEVKGWVDTRVFQYPGAGAVLLHDDVGGYLEPDLFVQVRRYDDESIVEAVKSLCADPTRADKIRKAAFAYVQAHHSYSSRVRAVLERLRIRAA